MCSSNFVCRLLKLLLSRFQACAKVTKYMAGVVQQVRSGLDGKNVDAALRELGIRFHRTVFEHLQQYQYSSMGATSSTVVHIFKIFTHH